MLGLRVVVAASFCGVLEQSFLINSSTRVALSRTRGFAIFFTERSSYGHDVVVRPCNGSTPRRGDRRLQEECVIGRPRLGIPGGKVLSFREALVLGKPSGRVAGDLSQGNQSFASLSPFRVMPSLALLKGERWFCFCACWL